MDIYILESVDFAFSFQTKKTYLKTCVALRRQIEVKSLKSRSYLIFTNIYPPTNGINYRYNPSVSHDFTSCDI